ncbi:MAG TPA: hypothetical protein VJ952_14145, partial [Opitutales bacterium]|nr:hypothetical protein [Opitutales bacterium]
MAIIDIYKNLDEEQRSEVAQLPRSERLGQIAALRQMSMKQLLQEVASQTGLPLVEKIDLIENPTWSLPLRLIHEYQCVPVQNGQPEPAEGAAPEEDSAAPIPLVTLWP